MFLYRLNDAEFLKYNKTLSYVCFSTTVLSLLHSTVYGHIQYMHVWMKHRRMWTVIKSNIWEHFLLIIYFFPPSQKPGAFLKTSSTDLKCRQNFSMSTFQVKWISEQRLWAGPSLLSQRSFQEINLWLMEKWRLGTPFSQKNASISPKQPFQQLHSFPLCQRRQGVCVCL